MHTNASDVKRVEYVEEATSQLAALCVCVPAVCFFFLFLIMNCVKLDSGDVLTVIGRGC